jgi:hypothetical protein
VAHHQSLQEATIQFFSELAATSVMVLNDEHHVPSSLIQTENTSIPMHLERYNNLTTICCRIQDCEKVGMDIDLAYTISLIQLRIKMEVLVHKTGKGTLNNIIKDLVKESGELAGLKETQVKHWVAWGSRLAEFSAAGEFFYMV